MKKNPRKQSKKPKKQNVRTKTVMVPSDVALSHCAAKYATAIGDPWSPFAEGACVPRHPSRPSHKVRGFARFTVTIGTGGVGYALFSPCLSNDYNAIYYSGSSYAGTLVNTAITNLTTGNNIGKITTLPYGAATLQPSDKYTPPSLAGRIVSAAISWQYTGTVSNMGGVVYALVEPNHSNVNQIGDNKVGTYAECLTMRVDNKRHWVGISAIDDSEINYPEPDYNGTVSSNLSVNYPYSNGQSLGSSDAAVGGAPIGLYFTGTAGNTFQVEVVEHVEYVGITAQSSITPTHSDARGFEIVQNASARIPALQQEKPEATRPTLMSAALRMVGRELAPVVPLLGKTALRIGAEAVTGAVAGGMMYGPGGILSGAALGGARGALRIANG
jgi:hypothetical protein